MKNPLDRHLKKPGALATGRCVPGLKTYSSKLKVAEDDYNDNSCLLQCFQQCIYNLKLF